MLARSRLSLLALVCTIAIALGCETASAAFAVDTSRLPRITGSREVFATTASTSFMTREPLTRAFELTATALINDDWRPYDDPFAARTSDASTRTMSFKKEGRALSLLVATTPTQANATSVTYTEVAVRHDLPFPDDATRITFDPEGPYLRFVTARDAEATLCFFRNELQKLGWSLWSVRDGATQAPGGIGGELTADGAHAYYVRDNDHPLMLMLDHRSDNGFNVEVTRITADQLGKPGQTVGATSPAKPWVAPVNGAQLAQAIPVPHASEEIDFDGPSGSLTFSSRASTGILAEYYRSTLPPLGWQETTVEIGNEQTAVLHFANGAGELSIAINQTGFRTRVTVEGSGLKVAAAISRSF